MRQGRVSINKNTSEEESREYCLHVGAVQRLLVDSLHRCANLQFRIFGWFAFDCK